MARKKKRVISGTQDSQAWFFLRVSLCIEGLSSPQEGLAKVAHSFLQWLLLADGGFASTQATPVARALQLSGRFRLKAEESKPDSEIALKICLGLGLGSIFPVPACSLLNAAACSKVRIPPVHERCRGTGIKLWQKSAIEIPTGMGAHLFASHVPSGTLSTSMSCETLVPVAKLSPSSCHAVS